MIEYYSTCKGLACNCNCELSLDYEDSESYYFKVTPRKRLVISKTENTTKGEEG